MLTIYDFNRPSFSIENWVCGLDYPFILFYNEDVCQLVSTPFRLRSKIFIWKLRRTWLGITI